MTMGQSESVQRSFRISRRTLALLDTAAAESLESRNALVDRLLGEAVRVERHPLIRFHPGAAGRRRPLVVGTRLWVYQIVATLRRHTGDIRATAAYFDVEPRLVQAALAYYADFGEEIDADVAEAERLAAAERARWERQRLALD